MILLIAKRRFLSNIFTMRFTISFILCVVLYVAEKTISFVAYASTFLLVMMMYTAVIFFATFVLFVRYDVR